MSKDKQIEDMVKICHFHNDGICHLCEELLVSCDRKCDLAILVENLYTAGYRKDSEVAREVIDEFERRLYSVSHRETSITGYSYSVIDVDEIAYEAEELKKKYIGKDTNVTTKERQGE